MKETLIIQSDMSNLPMVEERLFHFCRECNVGNYYSTVSFAAVQAVKNAIVHGNREEADKKVSLEFGTCRGGLYVEVTDEGEGFDYARYGQLPSDDEKCGEGIFVMKSLADCMTFSEGGRQVRLEFAVNGIDPADALERVSVLQAHFALVAA